MKVLRGYRQDMTRWDVTKCKHEKRYGDKLLFGWGEEKWWTIEEKNCRRKVFLFYLCVNKTYKKEKNMEEDIKKCIEVLRNGGLILYPTDTVWGIGCDATNYEAVAKVFALKQRDDSKSMITLFDSVQRACGYVNRMPDVAYDMMDLSDKPLTLILDGAKNLATNLVAEDGSVGIRVTNEKFSHDLCMRFKKPIVSTSANISGEPTAATYAEINEAIVNGVDYVVNYRRDDTAKHKPSSIIKLGANGLVKIIRE